MGRVRRTAAARGGGVSVVRGGMRARTISSLVGPSEGSTSASVAIASPSFDVPTGVDSSEIVDGSVDTERTRATGTSSTSASSSSVGGRPRRAESAARERRRRSRNSWR